jgi:predicted alpha/beta hydrolase
MLSKRLGLGLCGAPLSTLVQFKVASQAYGGMAQVVAPAQGSINLQHSAGVYALWDDKMGATQTHSAFVIRVT